MKQWDEIAEAVTQHGFNAPGPDGQVMHVRSAFRSFAPSLTAAQICGEVCFRMYLDRMGIPWRTLSADGQDEGTGQDDQPDPQ